MARTTAEQVGQLVLDFFKPLFAPQSLAHPSVESLIADLPAPLPAPLVAAPDGAASDAAQPKRLQHPRATHQLQLQQTPTAYLLTRCKRRSVGFVIKPEGLEVRAPRWVSLREIESLLQARADWVIQHWQQQLLRKHEAAPRQSWQAGSLVALQGAALPLALVPHLPKNQHQVQEATAQSPARLALALPLDADAAQIEKAAITCLRQQALQVFEQRLAHYAPLMGVRWTALHLSNAKTRWGSACATGSIRLHWRLIQLAPELLDYVVVHELAHLREMNHSPRFWAIVAQHCPEHLRLRKALKTQNLSTI